MIRIAMALKTDLIQQQMPFMLIMELFIQSLSSMKGLKNTQMKNSNSNSCTKGYKY